MILSIGFGNAGVGEPPSRAGIRDLGAAPWSARERLAGLTDTGKP
jgi:hypothetical protein